MRFPFTPKNRVRAFAANVVATALYTVAHTALCGLMRSGGAFVFGMPGYPVSDALLELPGQAAADVVYYGMIMASIYLIQHFIATHDLEAKLAEAKLENLRLQLHPHFLFNTLNAIRR